ncbi:protein RETICULATA-RELATED 1, chloroplastic [Cynara cardunculus var. scolymus]|uniref:protein RETICULATA-RELATED 1, chloroplastic n=1 Tax=Cynara cardunculus var. scolymus TaxID=59895 RepID=UPI000D629072|nr:protein RETICULATA-RELATED 1, chloroplastic [Cynara cardunculus var. scolymus]
MAISSQGFVVSRIRVSSSISESPKQSIYLKSLENRVCLFSQNPISRNPNSDRSLHVVKLKSAKSDNLGKTVTVTEVFDLKLDRGSGGGDDGDGKFPPGNGGGGGGDGGGGDEDDQDEKEFGPLMKFEEVMKVAETQGVNLPSDMLEAAKATGIRKLILTRYLDLQGSGWVLGFLMKYCAMLRNRMLADPSFLFKVGTEIVIDSLCATFAEVQKRGKDFWAEFELYAADLLVGIVIDIALVGMLAPYARIGKRSIASGGLFSGLKNSVAALPSSVFEFERPGCRFSAQQRLATYFYKGLLYGSVGFGCGLIGQGIANAIMNAKRRMHASEENVPVPPLVKSAVLWGVFLAVSSNTRYQVINGLESLVEASPLVKQVPVVAMAFTIGVRFANNIYGGMQFVDWARWSGVQ